MSDQQQIRSISIEPTPDGYRGMKRLFLETQEHSRAKIEETYQILDELDGLVEQDLSLIEDGLVEDFLVRRFSLLRDGLEAFIAQEHRRIASMQEGIDEIEKGGY